MLAWEEKWKTRPEVPILTGSMRQGEADMHVLSCQVRGKVVTVSIVTLSWTVESLQDLPEIAVAKPVKAADIEISKEGRDPRAKKAPAEPE